MASAPPRRLLAVLAGALALVVVVVGAVLIVRSARGPAAAVPPPASSTAGPSAAPVASPPGGGSATPDPTGSASGSASASSPAASGSASASAGPSSTGARPTATATTSGPAPTGAASTRPPAPVHKPQAVKRGLTAKVDRLEAVSGTASGPGEVAGPAVRVSLTLQNQSDDHTVDLSNTVVNCYYGSDRTPASALSGPGARALPTRLAAGKSGTGQFVFSVPADQRNEVLVTVDYSVDTPVVAFRGKAPKG